MASTTNKSRASNGNRFILAPDKYISVSICYESIIKKASKEGVNPIAIWVENEKSLSSKADPTSCDFSKKWTAVILAISVIYCLILTIYYFYNHQYLWSLMSIIVIPILAIGLKSILSPSWNAIGNRILSLLLTAGIYLLSPLVGVFSPDLKDGKFTGWTIAILCLGLLVLVLSILVAITIILPLFPNKNVIRMTEAQENLSVLQRALPLVIHASNRSSCVTASRQPNQSGITRFFFAIGKHS